MKKYYIPKNTKEPRVYLSRSIVCLFSFMMSILLIIAHISNSVPSFIDVSNKMSHMVFLSWFILVPVYLIYWVGLIVFPLAFLMLIYQIIKFRIINIDRSKMKKTKYFKQLHKGTEKEAI